MDEIRATIPLKVGNPQQVTITVVGCGGTGSYLVQRLARLAGHARQMNIEVGLRLVDPDIVEPKNLWRQLFVESEVGQPKARALAARYSRAFGLPIQFFGETVSAKHLKIEPRSLNVVVGCVDNTAARRDIDEIVRMQKGRLWWLDCGNGDQHGQVVFGNLAVDTAEISPLGYCSGLPLPSVRLPELVAKERKRGKRGRACADDAMENIQGLMVNETVASFAAHYLYRLVISQDLDTWATYVNLQAGNARSEYIYPDQANG